MTRQQKWAKESFERVSRFKESSEEDRDKYRTLCLKMPALLKQSGLVQALAFIRARSGEVGKRFCNDLASAYGVGTGEETRGQVLQEQAQKAPLPAYLALSRDLIDVSVWFRRFAQSELAKKDSPGEPAKTQAAPSEAGDARA